MVPVHFAQEGMPPLAASFVLEMPVTSEEARWAGVDNYGFPKIVADIAIVDEGSHTRCQVHHRGVHVLTLSVQPRTAKPFQQPLTLLNVRDDHRVVKCVFDVSGERSIDSGRGGVSLELGHHAIAEELRQIGLRTAGGRALHAPHVRAVLGRGIDLGRLPARTSSAASRVSSTALPHEAFPLV
jgi:hypothetical protein